MVLLNGGLLGCLMKREHSHTRSRGETDPDAPDSEHTDAPESTAEAKESTTSANAHESATSGDAEKSDASAVEPESEPSPHAERHEQAVKIVARIPLDLASDVAISRAGVVYVARLSAGLARAELSELAFVPIAADGAATSVAFGPIGASAYVAGLGGPLAMVDVGTNSIITRVGGGTIVGTPLACAVSSDGGTVILGVGGAAYTIDVATSALSTSIAIPGGVEHLSVHPAAPLFYATAPAAGQVVEVSAETQTVIRTFMLAGTPRGSVVSLDGATLFVANDDGHVDMVSLVSAAVTRVPLGTRGAFGIARSPDGARLYVTCTWSGRMHIVDIASRTIVDTIAVGGEPRGIAVSADGHTVAIANESGWMDFIR